MLPEAHVPMFKAIISALLTSLFILSLAGCGDVEQRAPLIL